jgi:ElaA protein
MIEWQRGSFDQLPVRDLYAVLQARQDIFILEQSCLYPDIDGFDQDAHHLLGWMQVDGKRQLVAYIRVIAPGVKYEEMSIGRVLTTEAARGTGAGKQLMAEAIRYAESLYPGQRIKIGAQRYLEAFYGSFGFVTTSEPYDEDGIMHVEMLR